MKQGYSAFVSLSRSCGRDGNDPNLFNKREFYEQMHELEEGKARHDLPAALQTDNECINSTSDTPSSSRIEQKMNKRRLHEEYITETGARQKEIIELIKERNSEKAKMPLVMERIIDKL